MIHRRVHLCLAIPDQAPRRHGEQVPKASQPLESVKDAQSRFFSCLHGTNTVGRSVDELSSL